MMKDYDPTTGNKMINKYMIVRELGRGVHGKVKLCRDTETNELCVSCFVFYKNNVALYLFWIVLSPEAMEEAEHKERKNMRLVGFWQ